MALFRIQAEHFRSSAIADVREFVKGKGIRVTKAKMDEIFTGHVHITVSCDNKRGANKVRDFIWDQINGGAYCSVDKVKTKPV